MWFVQTLCSWDSHGLGGGLCPSEPSLENVCEGGWLPGPTLGLCCLLGSLLALRQGDWHPHGHREGAYIRAIRTFQAISEGRFGPNIMPSWC